LEVLAFQGELIGDFGQRFWIYFEILVVTEPISQVIFKNSSHFLGIIPINLKHYVSLPPKTAPLSSPKSSNQHSSNSLTSAECRGNSKCHRSGASQAFLWHKPCPSIPSSNAAFNHFFEFSHNKAHSNVAQSLLSDGFSQFNFPKSSRVSRCLSTARAR